jgi:hypothetical protein
MLVNKQLLRTPWPIAATLGICVGLALGALATMANAGYPRSEPNAPAENNSDECWNTTGGADRLTAVCGSDIAANQDADDVAVNRL